MSLNNILNYLSLFSGLLPVIAAIYCYKRLDPVLKLIAIFFFISSVVDTLLLVLPRVGIDDNAPLIHLFTIVIVMFFGMVYYKSFHMALLKKITVGVSILAVMGIVYGVITEGIMSFPSFSNSFLSVVLTLLSLLYFYQLLNAKEFVHIEKLPMFWINAGVLFYFGINIFLFMLFDKFINHRGGDVWIIHDLTNVIANILYSVGLLCQTQTRKMTTL